jgi:hypothetical protein
VPLIAYPSTLPGPSAWSGALRERAARSSLAGDPQARRRWRDAIADVASATWNYSAAELAIWREWFADTLVDGQLWFEAQAPGAGGFVDRVMRFRPSSVRVQPLGNGAVRVSAQLEVRGRTEAPRTRGAWSSVDKSASVELTNGGTRATLSAGGPNQHVRGDRVIAIAENVYLELVVVEQGESHDANWLGLSGPMLGDANADISILVEVTSGDIFLDLVNVGSLGDTVADGDVLRFALRGINSDCWIALNGGAWVGGGDPVAGTSRTVDGVSAREYTAHAHYGNGMSVRKVTDLNPGPLAYAVPTGFDPY